MKKLILAFFLLFINFTLFSQQQAMYTQYMFNQLALNPAYAGIHNGISASALLREQWVGLEGAPSTQTFSIHSPIKYRAISLGAVIIHDKIGVTNQHGAYFSYAYRIKTSKTTRLSLGIQASFSHYNTNFAEYTAIYDPNIAGSDVNTFKPNAGAGVMWHGTKFYVGFSTPQMIKQKMSPDNTDSDSEIINHYYFLAGYVFDLGPALKLKPNMLVKYVKGAPAQVDLNINALFISRFWLGLSYRSLDSFDLLMQFEVTPNLQVGYAYDFITTTDLSRVNSGSHELMINYVIRLQKDKVLTPRYF